MRLVLDTNIVISGLLWRGSPSMLLTQALETDASLHTSERLLLELSRSLGKPAIGKQIARLGLSAAGVADDYREMCSIVVPSPVAKIAPDPDDDWVIATAVAANAELIVTGDKPLLGVGSVGSIRIVSVAEALALMRAD